MENSNNKFLKIHYNGNVVAESDGGQTIILNTAGCKAIDDILIIVDDSFLQLETLIGSGVIE